MKKRKINGITCPCGHIAVYNEHLTFNNFEIDGWECRHCKEIYYNPEKAQRILWLNKLEKLQYRLKLSRIKSNLIVRIPKEVSDALNLQKGNEVLLGLRDKRIITVQSAA